MNYTKNQFLLGLREHIDEKKRSGSLRLLEQDEKALKTEIAREAVKIGVRFRKEDDNSRRDNLNMGINLLTQAQQIVDDKPKEARRLFNVARRISRKK